VYERTHTRDLTELGPMDLNKAIPFAAVTFVIAGIASMGLPGFSGFVAELMVLIGVWHVFPTVTIFVGLGLVVGVAYTWRAMQKAFFADTGAAPRPPHPPMLPISLPERIAAVVLIGASMAVGLYPHFLLRIVIPALNSPLFEGLRKGSWQ
jgi:NADH-quinone oxidoreductase subunit M